MRVSRGTTARFLIPLAAIAVSLLGACHRRDEDMVEVAVIGGADALQARGPRLAAPAQLVQAATAQGLVALDEQGQVAPALAERWIVTDDGSSYIFRLRDGTWPDGDALTAESVARALRRALAALRNTPLGLDLADLGEVRVMTDRVLELRLARPVPELLQMLAQPELGLVHKGKGAGPFERAPARGEAASAAGAVLLEPIAPARLGLPAGGPAGGDDDPRWGKVRLRTLSAAEAAAAFTQGEVNVVLGGRYADLPLGRAAAGLSRRSLRFDLAPGLFGLAVVNPAGPLASAEFRTALGLAIDRDAVGGVFGVPGWVASARILPAAVPDSALLSLGASVAGQLPAGLASAARGPMAAGDGAAAGAALSPDDRRARALAMVERTRLRFGGAIGPLRLALPAGPGADALFAQLTADLGAIGVRLVRVDDTAPADLRVLDSVARYPGPLWILNQLSCAARRTICSPAADAQLAAARAEPDPARRAALFEATASTLSAAGVFTPFGPPVRWSLARPDKSGFVVNAAAFHPLPPLARRPD